MLGNERYRYSKTFQENVHIIYTKYGNKHCKDDWIEILHVDFGNWKKRGKTSNTQPTHYCLKNAWLMPQDCLTAVDLVHKICLQQQHQKLYAFKSLKVNM